MEARDPERPVQGRNWVEAELRFDSTIMVIVCRIISYSL